MEPMIYYFNFDTGESSWEHPSDAFYRQLVQNEQKRKEEQDGIKRCHSNSGDDSVPPVVEPLQLGSAALDQLPSAVSVVVSALCIPHILLWLV